MMLLLSQLNSEHFQFRSRHGIIPLYVVKLNSAIHELLRLFWKANFAYRFEKLQKWTVIAGAPCSRSISKKECTVEERISQRFLAFQKGVILRPCGHEKGRGFAKCTYCCMPYLLKWSKKGAKKAQKSTQMV